MRALFRAAALLSLGVSVAIVLALLGEAVDLAHARRPLAELWGDGWFPRRDEFDLLTLVVRDLLVAAVAMVVAAPLGLGAAMYLSEFASPSRAGCSSRRSRRWPASRASCSGTSRSR